MTLHEVLRAALRRWYVLLLVLALGLVGAFLLQRDGGSYATRTSVVFTLPGQAAILPDNGSADERVIAFAADVAQEINDGEPAPAYASADAPAYGAGVREGMWIGLPNYGGQWQRSFGLAQIEIQIVGRTETDVYTQQQQQLRKISEIASARQEESGVDESELIRTSVVPLTATIDHIAPSRIAVILAFAAMGAASLVVGYWAAVQVDRRSGPRRRRRGAGRARRNLTRNESI